MSRKRRRRRSKVLVYLATGVVLAVAGYWRLTSNLGYESTRSFRLAIDERHWSIRSASAREHRRPVYPHSIIRGGVYSPEELTQALENDSVAAAHYAGFRTSVAHLDRLDRTRLVYLSYRTGDSVRWTRNRVPLPAGEPVLSDGEHLARARCGNRISFIPQQPVGPDVEMDTPEPAPAGDIEQTADGAPDVSSRPLLAHEIFPPADVASPGGSNPWPTPDQTPGAVGGGTGAGPGAPEQGGGYAGGFGVPWVGGVPIFSHSSPQATGGPEAPSGPSTPAPSPELPLTWRPTPVAFSFTPPPGFSQYVPPDSLPVPVPPTPYIPFAPWNPPSGNTPHESTPPGDTPPTDIPPPGDQPPGDTPPGPPPDVPPPPGPPPSGPPPDVPPPPVEVPEPATQLLYGAGLIALGIAGRKISR